MGEAILVLGGARSGKSRLAERLSAEREPVTYVATATLEPGDAEMLARIEQHRRSRPAGWSTREVPRDLAELLTTLNDGGGTVLIDCVTLWASNLLLGTGGGPSLGDEAIFNALEQALNAARGGKARVVWVSNEVGSGVVPTNALARRFVDLQGGLNQRLAAACDAVHFCVAGLSLRLK
ncbi:MAG: bifunctional adenosylcobinamide kinase/adenosylcobinamide-phosphate guanylyltransferase [Isosphaeraceae bacterium]